MSERPAAHPRSTGMAVMAALNGLFGAAFLAGGGLELNARIAGGAGAGFMSIVAGFATSALLLAAAMGTWRVQAYGRQAALAAAGLGIGVSIIHGTLGHAAPGLATPGILYSLVLLIVYNDAGWRQAFRPAA